jgi:hypothetical protein
MAIDQRHPTEQRDRRGQQPPPPARFDEGNRLTGGGIDGNERLTAAAGVVLLVLFAALGVTIVRNGQLLWLHLFLGMLLIGPVLLKLASTGYRFARYYSGNPAYRSKGPPVTPMRLLAPLVVLSTVVVFGSGVALLFAGPSSRATLFPIHKLSFFAWLAFVGLHVLGHLADLPAPLRADYGGAEEGFAGLSGRESGRGGRVLALAGMLVAGLVLAVLVIPEFGPWMNGFHGFHHH